MSLLQEFYLSPYIDPFRSQPWQSLASTSEQINYMPSFVVVGGLLRASICSAQRHFHWYIHLSLHSHLFLGYFIYPFPFFITILLHVFSLILSSAIYFFCHLCQTRWYETHLGAYSLIWTCIFLQDYCQSFLVWHSWIGRWLFEWVLQQLFVYVQVGSLWVPGCKAQMLIYP